MLRNVYIHEINYLIQFRTTLLVTVFLCQIGIFTSAIRDTPNYDGGKHTATIHTQIHWHWTLAQSLPTITRTIM